MNYLALFHLIPMIVAVVKAVADQLPDSPGKTRLEAAVAMVMRLEGIAEDQAPAVGAVVNGVYAMLKKGGKVSAPPAAQG